MDFNKEYSEKFDELRKNRIRVSFHKYGSVADNYGKGFVQAIPTLEKCLDKYKETGNTEYLCDLANYAMFEFMYPQHPKGHFRATDSRESAGIIGLSVNEAKGIKSCQISEKLQQQADHFKQKNERRKQVNKHGRLHFLSKENR